MGTDTVILPRILAEHVDLIALNGTLTDPIVALNGTDFVTAQDTISPIINTMTISSWVKPEFNPGTPQFTIVSKENSFNLHLTNIVEPSHTAVFSVFDGIQWNDISGNTVLDHRWHHIMASVNGSKIALYVDGNLEDEQILESGFSVGSLGLYMTEDSQISVSDSDIVIGAYTSTLREDEVKTSNKFVGKLSLIHI